MNDPSRLFGCTEAKLDSFISRILRLQMKHGVDTENVIRRLILLAPARGNERDVFFFVAGSMIMMRECISNPDDPRLQTIKECLEHAHPR